MLAEVCVVGGRLPNVLAEVEEMPEPRAGPESKTVSLAAFSAYDLPSVAALVRYFHAVAGYPVKDTWLKAIKNGFYETWPGLTYANANKYCPISRCHDQGAHDPGQAERPFHKS